MSGMLRIPRSRGTLIAFIGPYFHYAYTPDSAWSYTSGRLWLEVLPGAGALVGGLIALASASRPVAMFGAWLAAISGAWFALTRVLEQIGFFTGLGVVIVFLAALALGRLSVVGIRDRAIPAGTPPPRRSTRRRRAAPEPEPLAEPAGSGSGTP